MSHRQSTPRGQMTRGANSGPAVMLIPPHLRATFMPNPPLLHIPPVQHRRKHPITGVSGLLSHFEKETSERVLQPTPQILKERRKALKQEKHQKELEPLIETYRKEQKESGGEHKGMNCYNTLFIGRLAYEVTERKLLREMESFGPVKDIRIIKDSKEGKSRGYAFVEYEHEEDMKRAYRAADGIRIEGREIVVDVERGHTVPSWLPRRLGGGLGGTRLGGKLENIKRPGRFDPSKPEPTAHMVGSIGMGRGSGPPQPPMVTPYGGGRPGGGFRDGPTPYGMGRGNGDRYGGLPPGGRREWDRGSGGGDRYGGGTGGDWDRKRRRSRSNDRYVGGGGSRRRY